MSKIPNQKPLWKKKMRTKTFELNKLVRDNIVQIHLGLGGDVKYKTLTGKKLTSALLEKLIEEAKELQNSELSVGEIADLKELVEAITGHLKLDEKELSQAQVEKRSKNGGFKKGHYIDTVTLPVDSKWAKYYAADPKRFPEIKK